VKAIFADSFYFLALLRVDDRAHTQALTASRNRSERLITTAWILTEVADALAVPGMRESFPRLRDAGGVTRDISVCAPLPACRRAGSLPRRVGVSPAVAGASRSRRLRHPSRDGPSLAEGLWTRVTHTPLRPAGG
jgi:hypothetical protein